MKTNTIRLQKFLSERGIASRRHAAEIIKDGKVAVNGKTVLEPGYAIDLTADTVIYDNKTVSSDKPAPRTIVMNKPRGYICSRSSQQGKTIYDLLPKNLHSLLPVGRLDKNSEGLLLLSNDGCLINRITHPSFEHEKTYHVSVSAEINAKILKKLNSRMKIDGYLAQPATVTILKTQAETNSHKLEFILKEGRKRQIRHMCEQAGLKIHRLKRVQIKNMTLKGLKPGKWRELNAKELAVLEK